MSQQKNQKNVVVYNYEPYPKNVPEPQVQQSRVEINDQSPFNVSRVLKAKQQSSNIFNLPENNNIDYSKINTNSNNEKLLPYDCFWWNHQNLKENKKIDFPNYVIPNTESRPQTQQSQPQQDKFSELTEEEFLKYQQQQYQQYLVQKQKQKIQQTPPKEKQINQDQNLQQQEQQQSINPYNIIKQHNQMIETASFAQQLGQQQQQQIQIDNNNNNNNKKSPNKISQQPSTQLQNPAKVFDKVNNPNMELKQKNPNFSDVFGNGLEKYYQQKPQQNSGRKPQIEYMEESELYGAKYHQRQMLKGMSSQMDTHKYYDQMLDKQSQDQIKQQKKSTSKSPQNSPGKNLENDEKLFPKSFYTELTIRNMGKEVNWEKLNTQLTNLQMQLVDVTSIQDKNGKIKQHKIIVKHQDQNNLIQAKQWIISQGGRLVEEKVIQNEEEFLKIMKLKEGPKQKPIKITEEKERLKRQQKQRPASAVIVQRKK